MLLDQNTLRTIAECQTSGVVRTDVVSDGGLVFLGIQQDPNQFVVQSLNLSDGKLVPSWRQELKGADWQLSCAARAYIPYLFAFDRTGQLLALDRKTGQIIWSYKTPAPLMVPPQWVGNELVLPTIDGGLFFVAGPVETTTKRIEN